MSLKTDLGINGQTRDLGREFDMHEFKGYTIAEINNIKIMLQEMKAAQEKQAKAYNDNCIACKKETGDRIKTCETDIKGLQAFKNQLLGIAVIGGLVAGSLINLLFDFFMKK